MIVKTLYLEMYIPQSNSLKDKRRILKSLIQRSRQKFNVAISEIEDNDDINHSIIGIVTVVNSDAYADEILDKCLYFIESEYDVDIIKRERNRV